MMETLTIGLDSIEEDVCFTFSFEKSNKEMKQKYISFLESLTNCNVNYRVHCNTSKSPLTIMTVIFSQKQFVRL